MGPWETKDLSDKRCTFGSCKKPASTEVVFRELDSNDEWKHKFLCTHHHYKKFVGRWPGPGPFYEFDSENCKVDVFNRDKP